MKVHHELVGSLPNFRHAVVTIGTFDGVHIGHQKIIAQMQKEAAAINGETVIITFHPHPRKIVSSDAPGEIKYLSTLSEKIQLLAQAGIDHLVVIKFDQAFANQSAQSYIHDFLYKYFKPEVVIIGYDHRFGKGREGNYLMLEQQGKALGFAVKEISKELLNEVVISSTKIRQSLIDSQIERAKDFLGYAYFFEGKVVEGNKLGRTIGYPTANLEISCEEKLIPGDGVYAVKIYRTGLYNSTNSAPLKGMMNIGVRPTVDGKKRVIEVHIFDFEEDIYGQELTISIHYFLRGEIKFNGLDALKNQLQTDKQNALQLLQTA